MTATASPYVLITGSRMWTDKFLIHNVLTSFHWMLAGEYGSARDITLVSGACPTGADRMGEETASKLGWTVVQFPALWHLYGKKAGPMRNEAMVDFVATPGEPALCLAFILDGSKGATMTADLAEKAGIHTQRYRRWSLGVSPGEPVETGVPEQGDPDILRGVEAIERGAGVPEGAGDHG